MRYKYWGIFLLPILLLSGCAYTKYTYPSYSSINPKLHSLYVTHTKDASMDFDLVYDVFNKEIEQNIIEHRGTPMGKLEITQIKQKQQKISGYAYLIPQCLTLFIPSILGVPLCIEEYSPEYDFVFYDIKGNIIANYTFTSSIKFNFGIYVNGNKRRVSVLKDVMDQLRFSLIRDAHIINSKLENAINSATEFEKQQFKKILIENRKGDNTGQNSYGDIQNVNENNSLLRPSNNQEMSYSRSKKQIMADIYKYEKLKRDYEKYLTNENSKTGSSYSPTRAFMWEKEIINVNKKLQKLEEELLKATH